MIEIRQWQIEDVAILHRLHDMISTKQQKLLTYFKPNTFLRMVSLIQFYQQADPNRFLYRAIVYNKQVCGYVQAEKKTTSSAEIGYWLLPEYCEKGIMSEVIEYLCEETFQQLHVMSIYARVEETNIASQNVLLHHKFKLVEHNEILIYVRSY